MRTAARTLILTAILASLSTVASGYYHWTYFVSRGGPFTPVAAKFALNAVDDNSILYFVSDKPPNTLVPNDNYDALLSQIRLAAKTWNGVSTSQIRLKFGGISSVGSPQAAPGIDVVFDDDMPPGLLAQTKITTPADLTFLAGADPATASVPILRSRLQLRSDLTVLQQASFSDTFFLTMVHEFGHTMGLQHSMTSATMATSLTRGTSKSLPLSADDRAAISTLYPASGLAQSTGSISGQVLVNGQGVSLASVVAVSANGAAIGGMTNPDGTYRIDGIPPGDYYVYAHPLPPAQQGESFPAAIIPPVDPNGNAFSIDTSFDTQFFPGTRDLQGASLVTVSAAAGASAINFNLERRPAGAPIYNMRMYGYLTEGLTPVQAPPLATGDRRFLAFAAAGLLVPNTNTLIPGLSLSVIGDAAQFEAPTLAPYVDGFLIIVVDPGAVSKPTSITVVVNTPTDLYVLPAAFSVVSSAAPAINAVSGVTDSQGNATVTVAGSNLSPDMRFLFDGAAASGVKVNDDATLTMSAPAATGAHVAAVEVLANDGQSSLQAIGSALPPTFTYAAPENPSLTINPSVFTAGIDTMVEIRGLNTNFLDGQTVVGFGSSDIRVRETWVTDPGRILLNISVSPAATIGSATLTVATGLQVATLNNVVQILPAKANQRSLRAPVLNFATGLPGVPPDGIAGIDISGFSDVRGWTVSIGGVNTGFGVYLGRLYAFVTGATPLGPQVLRVIPSSGDPIPPILIQIDEPPPVVFRADGPDGNQLDDSHFANPADTITLSVARLGNAPSAAAPASSVELTLGGDAQTISSVSSPDAHGISRIQFALSGGLPPGSSQPIVIRVRNRISSGFWITLAPASSQ